MKKYKGVLTFIILLAVTSVFMLFYAQSASPLFNYPRGDGWAFFAMGKAVVGGKIPYIHFFDHKGPLIFFLNALPQYFIDGRLGIFILETAFMFSCVYMVYRIANLFFDFKCSMIFPLLYLLYEGVTMRGGNYTEEYTSLFSIIFIYLFLKFLMSKKDQFLLWYGLAGGVLFGMILMVRASSGFAVVAAYIILTAMLIKNKNYKNLFSVLGISLLGCLISILPFAIYFYVHGALYDMINGTFLFNYEYMSSVRPVFPGIKFICFALLMAIPTFLGFLFAFRKNRYLSIFIIILGIFSAVFIGMSKRFFIHYEVGIALTFTLGCMLCVKYYPEKTKGFSIINIKKLSAVIGCMTVIFLIIYGVRLYRPGIERGAAKMRQMTQIVSMIPESEKSSVLCYSVRTNWYFAGNIPINYKYFSWQEWWSYSGEVQEETAGYLEKNPPKWIICKTNAIKNKGFKKHLSEKYSAVKRNKEVILYHLNKNS